MEQSNETIRMGVKSTAERWLRVRRAMRKEDQVYAERLAEMIRQHSREGFHAFDDPLEAALFSVLIELLKEMEAKRGMSQQLVAANLR
jgi:hypothetical protein